MNNNPKQHPFSPKKPGDDACKWCPFHQKAHIVCEIEDWVCTTCGVACITKDDVYCPRCGHNYFTPKHKEPSNG